MLERDGPKRRSAFDKSNWFEKKIETSKQAHAFIDARLEVRDAQGLIIEQNAIVRQDYYADTKEQLKEDLRVALDNFALNWLRAPEIHRVYETRYDCPTKPEGVRRVA